MPDVPTFATVSLVIVAVRPAGADF